jgi:hypothetical protein
VFVLVFVTATSRPIGRSPAGNLPRRHSESTAGRHYPDQPWQIGYPSNSSSFLFLYVVLLFFQKRKGSGVRAKFAEITVEHGPHNFIQ